jgi:hypothetical protein
MGDIFKFWKNVDKSATIHPADKPIFDRLKKAHGFDLRCLPLNFAGRLRDAPVVLLYLSPGFAEIDIKIARSKAGQEHLARQRTGRAGLADLNPAAARWRAGHLGWLGDPEQLREKVAIANIGAYHSRTFADHHVLAALPSSRAMLDWAQGTLFPQAERGDRLVVCMRAANFWGLETGQRYGKALYAPLTTRGGHMRRGELRSEIERRARHFLKRPLHKA